MNTLNKILDKAKEVCSTDLATAERLGVTRSAVSVWRKGGKISPEHLDKLISVSGADPALALNVLAEQSARSGNTWATVAKRLGAAVAAIVVTAAPQYQGASVSDSPTEQSTAVQAERSAGMHIMSKAIGWLRRVWTLAQAPWDVPRGTPA